MDEYLLGATIIWLSTLRKQLKLKHTDRNNAYLQKGRRMTQDLCRTFVYSTTSRLTPAERRRTPLNASSTVNITRL